MLQLLVFHIEFVSAVRCACSSVQSSPVQMEKKKHFFLLFTDIVNNMSRALELLTGNEPWSWINNEFIFEMTWPTLSKWTASPLTSGIPTPFVQAVFHILG